MEEPLLGTFLGSGSSMLLVSRVSGTSRRIRDFLLRTLNRRRVAVGSLKAFRLGGSLVIVLASGSRESLLSRAGSEYLFLCVPCPDIRHRIRVIGSGLPRTSSRAMSCIMGLIRSVHGLGLVGGPSMENAIS